MTELFVIIIVALFISASVIHYLSGYRIGIVDSALASLNLIFLVIFLMNLYVNKYEYYQQVDNMDINYTPFASPHQLTLYTFLVLSCGALCLLWIKQRALPPLILVMAMALIFIGIPIHIGIIMQDLCTSEFVIVDTNTLSSGVQRGGNLSMFSIIYLLTVVIIITRQLLKEIDLATQRTYRSPLLNKLNALMAKRQHQPLWALAFALPVFLFITLILVLFGQDSHAITKVFTETTTWHFSTKTHPPILDHKGHYLCTVAACGDEQVVKPLGWGQRHGYPILVNRQLQIANAFEELIQENAPRLHKYIRRVYDDYGYPLSGKITSAKQSNLTYRLMKPLEWFFLFVLYLGCLKPEEKIAKQYAV